MSPQLVSHSEWYFYLSAFLLALLFSAFLYWRNRQHAELKSGIRSLLFALRFLAFLLSFLLLAELYLKSQKRRDEKPVLLMALDLSQSMRLASDSGLVKAFATEGLKDFSTALSSRFDLRFLAFGESCRPLPASVTFGDKKSDFESLFNELNSTYANRNLAALCLISDGIVQPEGLALNRVNDLGIPVYGLSCGDSLEQADIRITKVNHNQVVYLGNDFPMEVQLSSTMAKGRSFDLSIELNGTVVARQKIEIPSESYSRSASFMLPARQSGLSIYKLRLEAFPGEKNTGNNFLECIIDVQDKKQNILLVAAAPHPDIQMLRESILSSQNYSLDMRIGQETGNALSSYNLVIFHGIGAEQRAAVEYCRDHKLPFWIIRPAASDIFPGLRLNGNTNRYNDAEPYLDEGFSLFRISPELKTYLESCPAVRCFYGRHLLSNSTVCLLRQRIGSVESAEPLFLFNESDGLKSACFNGDGLWKWKLRDHAEHDNARLFDELVSSTLLYLTARSDKSQFRLKYPRVLEEGQSLNMEAEVYNRSFELLPDAEVTLSLRSPENKVYPYTFSNKGAYYEASLSHLAPGEYQFRANARYKEENLEKQGRFVVKALDAEQHNLVAKPDLLRQLAFKSAGRSFPIQQYKELIRVLLEQEQFKTLSYSESSLLRPIEMSILFAFILLLLLSEWVIRKLFLRI